MDRTTMAPTQATGPVSARRIHTRARFARAWRGTIRGWILVAFLAMSMITGALGVYTTFGITKAGVLVAKTFDQSLMSINYARAAAADFASMQAAIARRWITTDADIRHQLDQKVEALEQSLADDLAIAAERAQSVRAANAAEKAQQAVAAWSDIHRQLLVGDESRTAWEAIDNYARTAEQQIDLLINYTAGDGFIYRQNARATVALDTQLNLLATALAVILSAIVAWLLGRRIIGPVSAASAVAERIAHGDLGGGVPRGGADELGALLTSMGVMRDNIKAMMEREVAQRRSAQTLLADALANSREGVLVIDAEGRIALANAQAADFLGSSPSELLGSTFEERAISIEGIANTAKKSVSAQDTLHAAGEIRLADGRWLRVSRSATQEGGFIIVCSDISVLKEQESTLTATNLRLDAALDNMLQGLCLYDSENRLKVVNRRFCELFNLPPGLLQPGITFRDVLKLSVHAGNHDGRTVADLLAEQADRVGNAYFQELSNGRVVAVVHQPTADGGWVATYEDVTERRQAEERIAFMARHDALTKLPNRVLLTERIEHAVDQLARGSGFAVLCLDLDNFKQINDTLGHPMGDVLLKAVAERLGKCIAEGDTVARLGGDEFAVIRVGVDNPEEVNILADRLVEMLSAPYEMDGHQIVVGTSIGIALAPSDGITPDELLKNADMAMYRAKADGRGTHRFFEPEMDARLQARRALELDLRHAIVHGEFELHYQPLINIQDQVITGFEALVRWKHAERGMVSPAEFIPLAEETGLIVPIGEWVLRTACAEASTWPDHIRIAVNLSAVQFKNRKLVEVIMNSLAAARLSPQRLELEITESVLLQDDDATLAMLHQMRGLGVRISMDDFGTGYSSLSYLRKFPFDKIKIDQSFIRDLSKGDDSIAIVRAVASLAASLNIATVAEGVETADQLDIARTEGCTEVQGYFFSRPVPAAKARELLTLAVGRLSEAA
jgi:diguanylate cyclase (GGDEF)-like protein/PAS domain S-box-containing protein